MVVTFKSPLAAMEADPNFAKPISRAGCLPG
jgi:hypothetical protein